MAEDFVLTQTSIELQNDLNKIERMKEIRDLGVGLDYTYASGLVSARTTTEDTAPTDPPLEVADDGGNVILRIDNNGYLYTKEFDGSDYARRSAIYQIGTGLQLISGALSLTDAYSGLAKIYTIGQGLDLASGELKVIDDLFNLAKVYTIGQGLNLTSGELRVVDDLFNLAKIYNIGQGLQLNSGTLNADVKDVTVDGTSVVNGRIAAITMPVHVDSGDGAWEVADESGNVALRVTSNGHLMTQQFNSEDFAQDLHITSIGVGLVFTQATGALSALVSTQTTSEGVYEIADEQGHVALRITNEGHLLTSQFDSEEVGRLQRIYQIGLGLNLDSSGTLSVTTLGGVTDVRVDGISVVSNTIANVIMPVQTNEGSGAFEIADQDGNVALQITSEGHIKTKEFDSSNININNDFQVVQRLPDPDAAMAPKVVYNLVNKRLYILTSNEETGSTAILGIAILGQMVLGTA